MGARRRPQVIRIVRRRASAPADLYIDGEFFPYYTEDGFRLHVRKDRHPGVSLTILAKRVEVVDAMDGPPDGEDHDPADARRDT